MALVGHRPVTFWFRTLWLCLRLEFNGRFHRRATKLSDQEVADLEDLLQIHYRQGSDRTHIDVLERILRPIRTARAAETRTKLGHPTCFCGTPADPKQDRLVGEVPLCPAHYFAAHHDPAQEYVGWPPVPVDVPRRLS